MFRGKFLECFKQFLVGVVCHGNLRVINHHFPLIRPY